MDVCYVCGKPLSEREVIIAAKGLLFCSRRCGNFVFVNLDDVAEEVTPAEIGISSMEVNSNDISTEAFKGA